MNRRQDSTVTAPHTASRFAYAIEGLDSAAESARGRNTVRTRRGSMQDCGDYAEYVCNFVHNRELVPRGVQTDEIGFDD